MDKGAKTAEISDFDLAQQFLAGNQDAFEQIYNRHRLRVLSVCRDLTSVEDADDLAQDTWFRVQKKIATFQNRSAFTTWLHKIAVNICLRYIKKRKREMTVDDALWRDFENSDALFAKGNLRADSILEQKINDRRLDDFIATLDAEDRIIFTSRIAGEKPRTIAPLLQGCSPQYVSNRFGILIEKLTKFICGGTQKGGDSKI